MKKVSATDRLTPHFRRSELACKCRRGAECDAKPMDSGFMQKLEALREDWGQCLIATSGARCAHWNKLQGGAEDSRHLHSDACDFFFEDPNMTLAFVALAEKHGFSGIGHGRHKVHIDSRPLAPGKPPARWTYDD